MGKLLFDEQPIVISRELAKLIGLNEAIVLQQVHYWLEINRKANKNFHEGKHWTYNSIRAWHEENFDFWSFNTVQRTFAKLEDMGLLLTSNFNKDPRDKTKWYTIDENALEILKNSITPKWDDGEKPVISRVSPITPKWGNALEQNGVMQNPKMTQALPEISTETSTEIKSQSVMSIRKTDGQTKIYSMEFIENKLDFEYINRNVGDIELVDNIKTIILEVLSSDKKNYKIDGIEIDGKIVKATYLKLEERHIVHAVEKYKEQKTRIINVKAYMIACLYSSYGEYNLHYTNVAAQNGY